MTYKIPPEVVKAMDSLAGNSSWETIVKWLRSEKKLAVEGCIDFKGDDLLNVQGEARCLRKILWATEEVNREKLKAFSRIDAERGKGGGI